MVAAPDENLTKKKTLKKNNFGFSFEKKNAVKLRNKKNIKQR